MHDDQPGGVHPFPENPLVLRHYDTPVSVREMLHGTLDKLLDHLISTQETMGAASVTVMAATGATEELFGGRTMLIALDLDPQDCPGCDYCERDE